LDPKAVQKLFDKIAPAMKDRKGGYTRIVKLGTRKGDAAETCILQWTMEDKAPVAEDLAAETYKNLPTDGTLKVNDPEGQAVTYTVMRQPRRGEVSINADGTFTYTPKKNKVGTDSFTFTATDPAGNVSREATVTIQILKPSDGERYTDTTGQSCRFAAEWLRQTGIFEAENIGGESCFYPEKTVSQGEFLAMVIKTLNIPMQDDIMESVPTDTPAWLKPYLAAAIRSGLTANLSGEFQPEAPMSAEDAAVMLQNALDLTAETAATDGAAPVWAADALHALQEHGIELNADAPLTRGDAAVVIYRVAKLKAKAPGMRALQTAQ
jgi:VCBS repeat-containing protein